MNDLGLVSKVQITYIYRIHLKLIVPIFFMFTLDSLKSFPKEIHSELENYKHR